MPTLQPTDRTGQSVDDIYRTSLRMGDYGVRTASRRSWPRINQLRWRNAVILGHNYMEAPCFPPSPITWATRWT